MKHFFAAFLLMTGLPYGFAWAESHLRINQMGYRMTDAKIAIVVSDMDLAGKAFRVREERVGSEEFSGIIGPSITGKKGDTPFPYTHLLDFSDLGNPGAYRIFLDDGVRSHPFTIDDRVYDGVIDTLLEFLRVARCGNTTPHLHEPCHLHDTTSTDIDLTGGWHDAGDFLKFTQKEAYTTYLLLLAYDTHRDVAARLTDRNHNGLPDLLDEARIGLDYLIKTYPTENLFITRVGDFDADHRQGMRMPEHDALAKTNRPATIGFERNDLATHAAAMALAANIFQSLSGYEKDAITYRNLAERGYRKAQTVGEGRLDKLCLASTELFRASHDPIYLNEARRHNDHLDISDWGSYDNTVNFAHARLAPYHEEAQRKLERSLAYLLDTSEQRTFGYTAAYSWGSLYIALSGGSASHLYETFTGDGKYREVHRRVRDYTLGVNPWGVCFISGLGSVYPRHIHHNIVGILKKKGILTDATLTGGVALGPVDRHYWEKEWGHLLPWFADDFFGKFQPADCLYHDHSHDFVTNEPCIYGSAEAILFFSFYLNPLIDGVKPLPVPYQSQRKGSDR